MFISVQNHMNDLVVILIIFNVHCFDNHSKQPDNDPKLKNRRESDPTKHAFSIFVEFNKK